MTWIDLCRARMTLNFVSCFTKSEKIHLKYSKRYTPEKTRMFSLYNRHLNLFHFYISFHCVSLPNKGSCFLLNIAHPVWQIQSDTAWKQWCCKVNTCGLRSVKIVAMLIKLKMKLKSKINWNSGHQSDANNKEIAATVAVVVVHAHNKTKHPCSSIYMYIRSRVHNTHLGFAINFLINAHSM